MISYVDSRFLSTSVGFFISSAQELLGSDKSPREERMALVSAALKFASPEAEMLTSALEQQALRRLFKMALYLAQEARRDPRWERLGLKTDPVPELQELHRHAPGVMVDSGAGSTEEGRKAA